MTYEEKVMQVEKEIKSLIDGQLIVEYAIASAKFYGANGMTEDNSIRITAIQGELIDRNILTIDDVCRMHL